jgi:hypothetical protein
MSQPEDRLASLDAALLRIRQIGAGQISEGEAESFGVLPFDLTAYWDSAVTRLRALLDRCVSLASGVRWVESAGQVKTRVGWCGDLTSAWVCSIAPEQCEAHFAAIEADQRYRARMIQIMVASVQAAATLCAAAASPLMAPAALRAVMNLVSELQNVT